ncbi:MAG: hypothetical protein C9356_20305 [Oleiphilus sp.]|nr:MAG: hypothetical protein C9356_20305 [Oleiphilus sp.]
MSTSVDTSSEGDTANLVGFGIVIWAVLYFAGLLNFYTKSEAPQSSFEKHEMYSTIRTMGITSVDVDDTQGWMYSVETRADEYLVEARYQYQSKIFSNLPLFRIELDGGRAEILVSNESDYSRLELIRLFGEFMDSVNEAILKTPQKA